MKPKIVATLLSVVIFSLGLTGGFFLDRLCFQKGKVSHYKHFKKFMGPKRFDQIQTHLQKKFTKELLLTSDQQETLKAIFDQRMTVMKLTVKEHDQELESLKETTRDQIRKMLTSDQKVKFNQMVKEYKAKRARWKK